MRIDKRTGKPMKKCEKCDVYAPPGNRYCSRCEAALRKQMEGYLGDPKPSGHFSDQRGRRGGIGSVIGSNLPEAED